VVKILIKYDSYRVLAFLMASCLLVVEHGLATPCDDTFWDFGAGSSKDHDNVDPSKDHWSSTHCVVEPSNQDLLASSELSQALKLSAEQTMSERIKSWLGQSYEGLQGALALEGQSHLDEVARDAELFRAIERQWKQATPKVSEYKLKERFDNFQVIAYDQKNYKRFASYSENEAGARVIHIWDLDQAEPRIVYSAASDRDDRSFFKAFKSPWNKNEIVIAHASRVFVVSLDAANQGVRLLIDVRREVAPMGKNPKILDITPIEKGLIYRTSQDDFIMYAPLKKPRSRRFFHKGVTAFIYSGDKSNTLISVSVDQVKIWDIESRKLKRSFRVGLTSSASAFVPKSKPSQLILVSLVGSFLVYDLDKGIELSNHYLSWDCTLFQPRFAALQVGVETLNIKCGDDEEASFYSYSPETMKLVKFQLGSSLAPGLIAQHLFLDGQTDKLVSWQKGHDRLDVFNLAEGSLDVSLNFAPGDIKDSNGQRQLQDPLNDESFLFHYVSSNPYRPNELLSSNGSDLIAVNLHDETARFLSKGDEKASGQGGQSSGLEQEGVFLVNEINPNLIMQIGSFGDVRIWDFYSPALGDLN